MTETAAVYTNTELSNLIRRLAEARQTQARCKARQQEMLKELEQSIDWRTLQAFIDDASAQILEYDASIRELAVELHEESGSKTPHPAVKVQMTANLEYPEPAARQWCFQHLPNALYLNKTLFERHAKAILDTAPIEFVFLAHIPRATIAQDLTPYLSEINEANDEQI